MIVGKSEEQTRRYRYVYGPVSSRRLGRSLGLDLAPYKTCSYDCIYCQLGRTTSKTLRRAEYIPVDALLDELEGKIGRGPAPDYITLAGSGEPTLHSGIGELVDRIKTRYDIPLAVLTNGSLLWMDEVAESLLGADLIVPSLDAGDNLAFQTVNRPHPDIDFEKMVEGLVGFRQRFRGMVWLEVFLVADVNGFREHLKKIADIADRIEPDLVQINTVSRPPCELFARPVAKPLLDELASLFRRETAVISEATGSDDTDQGRADRVGDGEILALLARRPCTARGVAEGLSMHINEASKRLQALVDNEAVSVIRKNDDTFYLVEARD